MNIETRSLRPHLEMVLAHLTSSFSGVCAEVSGAALKGRLFKYTRNALSDFHLGTHFVFANWNVFTCIMDQPPPILCSSSMCCQNGSKLSRDGQRTSGGVWHEGVVSRSCKFLGCMGWNG